MSMKVRSAGVVLICVAWVCALSMFSVLGRFGEWRKGATALLFGTKERQLSHHLTHRSLGAMALYASLLFFDCSVSRSICVDLFVIRDENAHILYIRFAVALITLTFFSIAATTFVRAWRVRMRHMYYVVLRNAGWSKLMDPSLEDSLSFWVKYKAMLTSDRGMLALVSVWVAVGVVICICLHHHFQVLRVTCSGLIVLMCFASIALVYGLPECDCRLRREVLTLAALNLVGFTLNVIVSIKVEPTRVSAFLGQCIVTVMDCGLFFVAFVWTPHRFAKAHEMDDMSEKTLARIGSVSTADKLIAVLSDTDQLSKFMQFCCDHFCAENLLALLEIKAFKQMIRKQLGKAQKLKMKKSATPTMKATVSESSGKDASLFAESTGKSGTQRTETSASSKSGNAADENLALFSCAAITNLHLSEHIDERWTRWDLSGFVRLSALGCRSAIVSGAGNARSKALSLCQKYFEWDSEFSLNISYQNRSKVLGLAGKDAAVALEPVALLYVFDEAMCDVFDNLGDPLTPFLKQQTK